MKTVLIPITSNFIVRNFLRTDTGRMLASRPDIRMAFLASRDKLAYYRSEFPFPNAIFDILPDPRRTYLERVFSFAETASIHSCTVVMMHKWRLHRRNSQAPFFLRLVSYALRRGFWHLGAYHRWRSMIRRAYGLFCDKETRSALLRHKPDLVFAATMLPRDMAMLREARRLGIRTLGMTLSWDNLYNKTMLRVHPDGLLVQTAGIREQAITLGDYPAEKIEIVGIPQYDDHFLRARVRARDEFLSAIGADPKKKLILYAFSGKAGLAVDFEMADILASAIREGEIAENAEVLLRPYPRYDFPEEKLARWRARYGFLAFSSAAHAGEGKEDWEFDEDALDFLANSLAHADVVITMFSTFFIEAAIFDRPLVGVAFDGSLRLDYWNSAARFFDWDHLSLLKPLEGIRLVGSRAELVRAINEYLQNPALMREGRTKIVAEECQFSDGKSGARVAQEIVKFLDDERT